PAAIQAVVAGLAEDQVVPGLSVDHVVAGPARKAIGPGPAPDHVVARAGGNAVVAAAAVGIDVQTDARGYIQVVRGRPAHELNTGNRRLELVERIDVCLAPRVHVVGDRAGPIHDADVLRVRSTLREHVVGRGGRSGRL